MMILLNLLLLTNIIVFIIDISGIVEYLKQKLFKWLYPNKQYKPFILKPFDCSLCLTFWIGIIFLLITKSFTIPLLAYTCALAFLTPVIGSIWMMIKDIAIKIINKIYAGLNL